MELNNFNFLVEGYIDPHGENFSLTFLRMIFFYRNKNSIKYLYLRDLRDPIYL